ncbi:DUF72 domain-containing protein [Ferruginibacter albus]|uniref:DUF72 domain-containing protein n=1 Tax=Ferruginibacter albus TaxID=2875540 RepID=UPI001CC75246|nr:DUF72 domain-containing protein [Ferruginibacter albus]
MKWKIGCSGFHYEDWQGIFYPADLARNKWFEHYSKEFKTLELNVTFYRFPQLKFLQDWYTKSQKEFRFSVKVPRQITHFKQLKESEALLKDFYDVIRKGLKNKLGPVLFQFPPSIHYSKEFLQRIIDNVDPSFKNVVEFRHHSWWNGEVYTQLAKHKITFCGISYPNLPADVIQNTSVVYYRFHGVPELYRSEYAQEDLENFVMDLHETTKVKDVYVYFNNTIQAAAIRNAEWLNEYVRELKEIAPDGMVFGF